MPPLPNFAGLSAEERQAAVADYLARVRFAAGAFIRESIDEALRARIEPAPAGEASAPRPARGTVEAIVDVAREAMLQPEAIAKFVVGALATAGVELTDAAALDAEVREIVRRFDEALLSAILRAVGIERC